MKKKLIAILLVVALVASLAVGLVACGDEEKTEEAAITFSPIAKENIKLGLITLHGEESTYDKNFIDAAKAACSAAGVQIMVKSNIAEGDACYEAAADLAEAGCNIIFADSFGHEPYLLKAAKEYPTVRFAHATGTTAHTELQGNFYNAFASIYEGRFLAGYVAGLKLQEMIENGEYVGKGANKIQVTAANAKIGYVGAFTYAEVISGLTSFYLGVKTACPTVKMDVRFTGSWYDATKESEAANALIEDGCVLISQHADSMGAPNACETAGIPNVTYNISTKSDCSTTYLCGSKINWAPYFEYLINCTINGVTAVDFDWTGSISTGSVELLEINDTIAAEGTAAKVATMKAALLDGTVKVFDIEKDNYITKDGKKLSAYLADVDTDANYTPDTQVISGGVFMESAYRSAPYFDINIDGITYKNTAF